MNYWDKKLIREQLDERLSRIRPFSAFNENGWIKILREALGMTTKQLGKRVGIDQSRISRLENAEIEGDLKLSSLKKNSWEAEYAARLLLCPRDKSGANGL